ncbi:MAG TPA: alpha-D-ribose 1-methylphosphonate 5-triphosphate diphosphatase [Chthonomonadaceae bacterium]|nr:alpha-D-ribose 1-methylphosphonate 5-triphosphate diphosphatase [Chthonomonadaceae bacterium]
MVSTLARPTATRTYLTNATVVLPDRTLHDGAVLVEEGLITAICPDAIHGHAQEVDLESDILMPGIIDLHGDAIEREMEPRERARLPLPHAVLQGDRKCALAGITTMFHALAFVGEKTGKRSYTRMTEVARLIRARAETSVVDNRIHCRFEMTSPAGMPYIKDLIDEGLCEMMSLNNHSPGQGQYRDLSIYRQYMKGNYNIPDAEIDRIIAERIKDAEGAEGYAEEMADYTLRAGIPLASHDDDDGDKVRLRHSQGSSISEFPLTLDAAQTATTLGMHAIVGSPNVMRGGSTGTGASALDLVAQGVANCLCSDYAPSTMLPATFQIAHALDWPLHRAALLTTTNPAAAARLQDRGAITVGMQADLIAVREYDGVPAVRCLWSRGRHGLRFY